MDQVDIFDDLLKEFGSHNEKLNHFLDFLNERLPDTYFHVCLDYERGVFLGEKFDLPDNIRLRLDHMAKIDGLGHIKLSSGQVAFAMLTDELKVILYFLLSEQLTELTDLNSRYNIASFVTLLTELFFMQEKLQEEIDYREIQFEQINRKNSIYKKKLHEQLEEICQKNELIQKQQSEYSQNLKFEIAIQTKKYRQTNERLQKEIKDRILIEQNLQKAKAEAECAFKQAEQLNEKLEKMISEYKEMQIQAENANKAKSEFLANMSHEIRTPLNSIIGFADLMAGFQFDDENWEYLQTIRISAHSLLDLINDILDFSKIEAGEMDIECIEFDLLKMFRDVYRIHSGKIFEKGLQLHINIDQSIDFHLIGDRSKLRQVLVNLVGNAAKFTNKGNIYIEYKVKDQTDNQISIQFNVVDEGIGISKEKIDSIFSAFKQVDNSISRKYGGTGLGLAISNQLVRLMGGDRIFVESTLGKGSKFSFCLNFSKGSSLKETKEDTLDEQKTETKRVYKILLVEDTLFNINLILAFLQKKGHSLVVAKNGAIALEQADKENFDVILMDVQMPVMDGFEATKALRAKGNSVPIIAMTASAMQGDKQKCFKAGMNGFIAKPININNIEKTIQNVIEKHSSLTCYYTNPQKTIKDKKEEDQQVSETKNGIIPEKRDAEKIQESQSINPSKYALVNIKEALERLNGSMELYIEMLYEFDRNANNTFREIREAFDIKDMKLLYRLVHTLKGTSSSISANNLASITQDLLLAIKAKAFEKIEHLIDNTEDAFNNSLESVKMILDDLDSSKAPNDKIEKEFYIKNSNSEELFGLSFDKDSVINLLCELLHFVKNCDLLGAEKCMDNIDLKGSNFHAKIIDVECKIKDFDFEEAEKDINDIIEELNTSV